MKDGCNERKNKAMKEWWNVIMKEGMIRNNNLGALTGFSLIRPRALGSWPVSLPVLFRRALQSLAQNLIHFLINIIIINTFM
jgi:hypothetical protein